MVWEALVIEYQVKTGRAFDHDMERIHQFLLKGDYYPSTIKEIFEGIYTDLARLRTSPRLGARLSNKTSIPNDYRYLVSGQYLIFYKVFESKKLVQVYRVFHGKENYLVKLGM